MREFVAALCLCLLLNAAAAAQTKTDRERQGLLGPVKTVSFKRIETVLRDGKPGQPKELSQQLTAFHEQGRKVREDRSNDDGTLGSQVYIYDGNGRMAKESGYDGAGKLIWENSYQYEFDAQGRLTRSSTYNRDGIHTVSNYNDRGLLADSTTYNRDVKQAVSNYNDRGLLAEGTTYNRDGSVSNKSVFTYDEKGVIAEITVYNSAGFVWQKQVHTSTSNDMIIRNSDGTLRLREVRGAPAREEFDSHGNWTKQTTRKVVTESRKFEEMVEVMVRTIVYY